jgi:hypothetical protein
MSSSACEGSATPLGCGCARITAAAFCVKGLLHDLPRVNRSSIDRALEHFLVANQAMAFVEENHSEDFSL